MMINGMDSLSSEEIGEIKKELQSVIDTLIRGCEALDMKTAFQMFCDSDDFLMMGTDGSLCDYGTYLENNINYLGGCRSFRLTTHDSRIRVFDKNTAVYSWAYGVEAVLKTGGKDIIEKAGASFFFRRIDGTWKVVYYHEASVPPVRIEV